MRLTNLNRKTLISLLKKLRNLDNEEINCYIENTLYIVKYLDNEDLDWTLLGISELLGEDYELEEREELEEVDSSDLGATQRIETQKLRSRATLTRNVNTVKRIRSLTKHE